MLVEHKLNHIPDICPLQLAHPRLKSRDNLRFDVSNQSNQQRIPGPKVILECTQLHATRPSERSHAETAVPLIGNELNRRSQNFSFSVSSHNTLHRLAKNTVGLKGSGETKTFLNPLPLPSDR